MSTYRDFADDLRGLAVTFDHLAGFLPQPKRPEVGLEIMILLPSPADVEQAARTLGTAVTHSDHPKTEAVYGTVRLRFVHVSDESLVKHFAQTSYAANIEAAS